MNLSFHVDLSTKIIVQIISSVLLLLSRNAMLSLRLLSSSVSSSAVMKNQACRLLSTGSVCLNYRAKDDPPLDHETYSRINFKNIRLYNKRHSKVHKEMLFKGKSRKAEEFPYLKVHNYGCRRTGIDHQTHFENVPEMEPELIVPDLTDFNLKPYVSYATKEVFQEPYTASDMFNAVYGKEIMRRYHETKTGKETKSYKEELKLIDDPEIKARQTGSDLFRGGAPTSRRFKVRWDYVK